MPIRRVLKANGFDGGEVPVFDLGDPGHYLWLGGVLDDIGLERTVVAPDNSAGGSDFFFGALSAGTGSHCVLKRYDGLISLKGTLMNIPKGATVAVADGEKLNLYRNDGEGLAPELKALPDAAVSTENKGSGVRHQSSSANPGESQQEEDSFAAGTAAMLNKRVLDGEIKSLVIVAAPRTLGELRKHYHKALSAVLVGEISKDLTGHSLADVQKALANA